jgi:predicted negative regulator of RcsB-dependent stress response
MADDNLDFTDKIAQWGAQNIKYISIGVLIGVLIPLAWNYNQYLELEENLTASELYYKAINIENSEEDIAEATEKILLNHPGSIYEVLTKFILSKQEFENKNYTLARKYLEQIIDTDASDTYNSLASIKISLIRMQEKEYELALNSLENVEMKEAFKQILSETKGDIYKHMGDMEKSFKYYNEAIDASAINNENLLMKYNSVKN